MNLTMDRDVEHEAAVRLEDIAFMAESGESFERAALRLGMSEATLSRFLLRQGRNDLAKAFRGRH